jgi:predicted AAA+ superfamily ATPase
MRDAFNFTCDEYIFYGGYPGAASLIKDQHRWERYIRDSLIETTISRDILLLTRVDKPALLRRLFELGCLYSGQIISYNKILGQVQDAGNTTTLAHYLELLSAAGMVTGLQKFSNQAIRVRGSSPKMQVLNTALVTAQTGLDISEARKDTEYWGRLVESAVGAHLANAEMTGLGSLYYWRDHNREVDFVFKIGRKLTAIEVKSGRAPDTLPGMMAFSGVYKPNRKLLVGTGGIAVENFLSETVEHWIK